VCGVRVVWWVSEVIASNQRSCFGGQGGGARGDKARALVDLLFLQRIKLARGLKPIKGEHS